MSRKKKNADKVRSLKNKEFCMTVFDLEKVLNRVLNTPQDDISGFYYKCKFATYNFTVFNIRKKHG